MFVSVGGLSTIAGILQTAIAKRNKNLISNIVMILLNYDFPVNCQVLQKSKIFAVLTPLVLKHSQLISSQFRDRFKEMIFDAWKKLIKDNQNNSSLSPSDEMKLREK